MNINFLSDTSDIYNQTTRKIINILKISIMKKVFSIFIVVLLVSGLQLNAQNSKKDKAFKILNSRGEIYFSFSIINRDNTVAFLQKTGHFISIDKKEKNIIFAYANKKEFEKFLKLNIDYNILTPPSMLLSRKILDTRPERNTNDWDYYPTYNQYIDLMNGFANDYPDLCELINIGQTVEGRSLLFIHINDSLGVAQNEPEFMYTATMHGDETTPYVLMLHLIDYLLSNYGTDTTVTYLVNHIDIWINPLANPDGTYAGGNNTVYGATRTNGNNIDLNRNYPDPDDGPHPDGNAYQPETQAFMDFADEQHFVLSCNMHTGAEVANYPWDTWSKRHADDLWWIYVCRQYADTVHAYSPANYFTDENNGITNGYDWYTISGGRQDYMNYFKNCREFTLELSHVKIPPPSQLPNFWQYNYRSFLNYMRQSLYGVRGMITDKYNGNAIKAKIFVENHDIDNSWVYSNMPVGNYNRPIKGGVYDFKFSAFGYYPQTFYNISPTDNNTIILNVQLHPIGVITSDFTASDTLINPSNSINFYDNSYSDSIVAWQWTFQGGEPSTSEEQNPMNIIYYQSGYYDVSLTVTDSSGSTATTTKTGYVKVLNPTNMQNITDTTCSALFYDSGGPNNNYNDNEDIIMTFVPATNNTIIHAQFVEFNIENSLGCHTDYLSVFNGGDTTAELIGKYCGTQIPKTFVGSNEGSLTFYFHSNDTINLSGWKALITCDTNVGIVKYDKPELIMYPNPAINTVFIQTGEPMTILTITDISGQKLLYKRVSGNHISLALSNFSNGIYIIKIDTKTGTNSKKLIINR